MVFICQCMFSCLSTLKHAGVYMLGGGKKVGDGELETFTATSVWDEVTHPAPHRRRMRELAFK